MVHVRFHIAQRPCWGSETCHIIFHQSSLMTGSTLCLRQNLEASGIDEHVYYDRPLSFLIENRWRISPFPTSLVSLSRPRVGDNDSFNAGQDILDEHHLDKLLWQTTIACRVFFFGAIEDHQWHIKFKANAQLCICNWLVEQIKRTCLIKKNVLANQQSRVQQLGKWSHFRVFCGSQV